MIFLSKWWAISLKSPHPSLLHDESSSGLVMATMINYIVDLKYGSNLEETELMSPLRINKPPFDTFFWIENI